MQQTYCKIDIFSFSAALKRPLKTLLKRAWKAHFATLKTCQEELIKLAEVCCSRPQNVDFTIWKCDSWNWLTLLKRYKMEAWKGPIWTPQEGHATLIKMASRGCGKVISEVRFGPFCRGRRGTKNWILNHPNAVNHSILSPSSYIFGDSFTFLSKKWVRVLCFTGPESFKNDTFASAPLHQHDGVKIPT